MKSILITGSTGFFGNALVRRLLSEKEYTRICIFSRDEAKQANMRVKFKDDPRLRWFIGDVRDKNRLTRAMQGVDVIVHAAALKRIEVGAYNPTEMVRTNVIGSMNVVEAACDAGLGWPGIALPRKVVLLSSDKAYQPVSAYGQSKALAESIFLASNNSVSKMEPIFSIVRYGNVCGSTGSVIPIWREQLKHSDTVTVTDPDCTRFWMSADDAVDLVMDTINWDVRMDKPFIPTLPAFRLGDLAEAMGAKMKITGLPDWEKKHESMEDGKCSETAVRMSVEEIREGLKYV
jgi:UDP-N-acetylglucosamine 4,6-dehydratase/5-epimerase